MAGPQPFGERIRYATINATGAGTFSVGSAPASGKRLKMLMWVISGGSLLTSIQWFGNTSMHSAMNMVPTDRFSSGFCPEGHFKSVVDQGFSIVTGGGGCTGYAVMEEVDG